MEKRRPAGLWPAMRGLRSAGEKSGSAGRHLLRLLVLLTAPQGLTMVDGRALSRSIFQPAAVVVGTLLAPQAAQAQTISTVLTGTAGVNKVTLTWVATNVGASIATGHLACPNYPFNRWEYRQKAGSSNYGSWTTLSTTHTTRSHEVTGLTAGTVYKFQVRPVWACVSPVTTARTAGTSNEFTATPTSAAAATSTEPPAQPTNFRATPGNNGQVTLTWDDPEDSSITEYRLRYFKMKPGKTSGGRWRTIPSSDHTTTMHVVTGLENGSQYRFQIRARNSVGRGQPTLFSNGARPRGDLQTVSVPPTKTVAEGAGTVTIPVTATAAFGKAVTFNVSYGSTRTTSDTDATGAATPANGDYDNDAVTTVAFGASDTTQNIVIPITDDQQSEGNETFTVSIALAPSNTLPPNFALGVSTTTVVTITDNDAPAGNPSGGNTRPTPPPQTPPPPTPVAPAQPTGLKSATPLPLPSKPTGVTATAGDGQVTLAWRGPTDATISKWQVQQKEGDGSYGVWRDVPASTASTTSHTVTGLTNGKTYGFRIRAVNTVGNGAVSDGVTATPVQRPSKPTGVTATPGNGQVTLTWDNPDDATITRWQVQQKQGSGSYGPWRDVPNSNASTTTYTVTGLTNGTAYGFRIRAVNTAGDGDPSDEVTATPVGQDVVQADKARSQALAATSRTLLGMATDVLGSRTGGEAPVALAGSGDFLGEQAMGVVENLLGIGGSELSTDLSLAGIEDRLWSQSFQLTPSEGVATEQRGWVLWGAGDLRSYRSEAAAEGISSSGNLKTAWLGVDYPFTHRGLAGLALSFSSGQSNYSYRKTDGSKDGGRMDTRLTTFYPYGSFQVSQQLRLWAMAGIGWGNQHHQQTGDDTKAEGDLRLQMGVVGFEQALSPIGDLNLSLAGDAGLVKSTTAWQGGSGLGDLSVTLHRIRMGVDGSFPLAEHTTGYVNLKGRMDGGDLPMNAAELVAGVQYSQARFSGFLQGRQVYAFDGSYAESGLTAQLRLTANSDGTGLAWTLQPSYGAGNGDVALAAGPSLWTDQQLERLTGAGAAQQEGQHLEWSSRVGYGIRLESSDLLLTPFTEVRLWQGSSHRIGLGLTVEAASWNLEFSGSTEHTTNASPTGNLQLNFSKRL